MNYQRTNHNKARCLEALIRDKRARHREEALELLGRKGTQKALLSLKGIEKDPNIEESIKAKVRKILENFSQTHIDNKKSATTCPDCNYEMIPQNGCFFCPVCGYSKCG